MIQQPPGQPLQQPQGQSGVGQQQPGTSQQQPGQQQSQGSTMQQQPQGQSVQQLQQSGQPEAAQAVEGMSQQMGFRLQDVQSPQQRALLDSIAQAVETCEWCADQCIQLAEPNMIECIRLCRDVSDLGRTALAFLPRSSPYAQSVLRAFEQVASDCGRECSHHQHAHCQECAQVLPDAVQTIQQFNGTFQ